MSTRSYYVLRVPIYRVHVIEMSLEDVIETVTRVSVWVAAGLTCYAWYVEMLYCGDGCFLLVFVTSIAVDISSC